MALRRFGLEQDRLDAVVAHHFGASPVEFKAMDHIHTEGGLTPGQLGDRLALSSGAVTALIDRLESTGWARREAHPTDRRSVIIRPASGGEISEGEQLYAPMARGTGRAAGGLSATERAAFIHFLEAVSEVASERADDIRGRPAWSPADAPRPQRRTSTTARSRETDHRMDR